MTDIAPYVDWPEFKTKFAWTQGQHVILIGPNGSGKTVMNKELLKYRERRKGYICVFVTKPRDPELQDLADTRYYHKVADHSNWNMTSHPRLLLWPPAGQFSNLRPQRKVFLEALQGMWTAGKWTCMLNELRYLTDHLHMKSELATLYLQARSSKFTLTAESQRPRYVPLEAMSQSVHDFFFACRDDEDLRRISGIGNADSRLIRATVSQLKRFECCYVNAITGDVVRTKAREPVSRAA
jgi:hypothetical protein